MTLLQIGAVQSWRMTSLKWWIFYGLKMEYPLELFKQWQLKPPAMALGLDQDHAHFPPNKQNINNIFELTNINVPDGINLKANCQYDDK